MDQRLAIITGLLILYGATTGLALQCHVCSNMQSADCWNISGPNDVRFLKECPPDFTICTVEIKRGQYDKVFRKCKSSDWSSDLESVTCTTNGCNHGNEVNKHPSHPDVRATPVELIRANFNGIATLAILIVILVVGLIVICCTKDKDEVEEEEEEDDDDDEYDDEFYDEDEKEYVDDNHVDIHYEVYNEKKEKVAEEEYDEDEEYVGDNYIDRDVYDDKSEEE